MMSSVDNDAYERFSMIVNGPALFNAITSASEFGIFRVLSQTGGAGSEQLHAATGIDAGMLRVLMQALCVTGLIERRDGIYRNTPMGEDFLGGDGGDSWHHILLGWQKIYYPAFSHMTEALRAGTNTALAAYPGKGETLYQRLGADPALERIFHKAMAAFTLRSMNGLLENADFGSIRELLDVGGGDGTTARAVAGRFEDIKITIFDLPSVSTLAAQQTYVDAGTRIRLQPGDFFSDPFPTHADAVMFSHVLEVFEAEQICALLLKAFHALPSGGRILIYGFNVSDDETQGAYSARLSLYLNVLATGRGMAYPARDYEAWLSQAGFARVSTVSGLPYEHGLTIGTKP